MGKTRKYVEAKIIEAEMQESRIQEDFVGKVEEISIKQMVENGSVVRDEIKRKGYFKKA